MKYIMAEQQADGYWTVQTEFLHLGCGTTRHTAIMRARDAHPSVMQRFPLQPEEIPGELREIAKRMRAVSEPLIYFGGFGVRGDLGRSMEAQAPILAAWADLLEDGK